MKPKYTYPFTAIPDQEDLKLCLLLNLVDPSIGGVLATGDKGTAKTTMVRGLSQLMGEDFPFVNLPIGATEDRVLGSINLEALINQKTTIVDKGLLSQAHQGFLYIDEVNLLNDYLMDILLDASATGGYHLEREGISQWMDSRFCLVGTMNPEEGALRPQLLDRFGLSVTIQTPKEMKTRTKIAMQRLSFDSDPIVFYNRFQEEEQTIKNQVISARRTLNDVIIPESIQEQCAVLTIANQVEGMRADILLLKTARAYAAFYNEKQITTEMVDSIAPFVLQHRAKEYTPPTDQNKENPSDTENHTPKEETAPQNEQNNTAFQLPKAVQQGLKFSASKATKKQEVLLDTQQKLYSVSHLAERQEEISVLKSVQQYLKTGKFTTVYKQATQKAVARIIFLVDTSASMALDQQMAYLKGIIEKTIMSYPLQKIQYAIVGLQDTTAKIIQEFTSNTGQISNINHQLKTGGKTNLGAAFFKVYELLRSVNTQTVQLFVFTDGKINAGAENPFQYAVSTYKKYLARIQKTTVIDTETGFVRLGKARQLAQQLKLKYTTVSDF
ncbi:magnesium chelatase subunit D [Aquimarina sp. EL_43]|uniref:VWA domain-containing protein n=1 Tax=unclassified Aquimarina TaxID=2627091 RepID=UPI0018CB3CB0|nr:MULTISPECIES: VWA domain-containing protein [unclassified Aquimarina]MBG6130271.1 magnesium chelatase subunit D [Aquimarina sp. EL_35]MBG6149051.1 magnesium chelatase subunit D [Aquimarina sp. EL_32]MBG6168575.1 magnesium chelatase subunit D [Aquimarina sp. EL_43]